MTTGQWIKTLVREGNAFGGAVSSITFVPNQTLALLTASSSIELWDVVTGELKNRWSAKGLVHHLSVSPDGQFVAITGERAFGLWRTGQKEAVIEHSSGEPYAPPVFSPDSKRVLFGDRYHSIVVIDTSDGKTVQLLLVSKLRVSPISDLVFDPNGKTFASALSEYDEENQTSKKTIHVWDVASNAATKVLTGTMQEINHLEFTPDSQWLISGSEFDKTVRMWNLTTGQAKILDHYARSFALNPSRDRAVVVDDNSLKLWDMRTGTLIRVVERLSARLTNPSFSADGKRVAYGINDEVHIRDAYTGELVQTFTGHQWAVEHVVFSPVESLLAASTSADEIFFWNTGTGAFAQKIQAKPRGLFGSAGVAYATSYAPRRPMRLAFSPDGKWVAASTQNDGFLIFNIATGKQEQHITAGSGSLLQGIAFTPDSQFIVAGIDQYEKSSVGIWSVATGAQKLAIQFNDQNRKATAHSFAISPDGKQLAIGTLGGRITLWDATSGVSLAEWSAHADAVSSLAFSPDGRKLASGSADKQMKLWDVATNKSPATNESHTDQIDFVEFSPDGRTVASSAGINGAIYFWDVGTY